MSLARSGTGRILAPPTPCASFVAARRESGPQHRGFRLLVHLHSVVTRYAHFGNVEAFDLNFTWNAVAHELLSDEIDQIPQVSRGMAVGDLFNDGRVEAVVENLVGGPWS